MKYKTIQYDGMDIRFEDLNFEGENKVSIKKPNITPETLKNSLNPIIRFSEKIVNEMKEIAPDEFSLELGLDFAIESGNLCWGIAKGTTSTHFQITMTWKKE